MTKYEAVAQAIKNDIENGLYKEGQPIPTEELLTAQYDVSRQTIRKALSLLVEDNLILKRQGSGSVVRPKRLNPRTGKIAVVATYISDYIFPSQLRAVNDVLSKTSIQLFFLRHATVFATSVRYLKKYSRIPLTEY